MTKKKYNLRRLLPMIIVIIGALMFFIFNENLNRKFVRLKVENIILKRDNWQLKATEFYLENGLRIDSTYLNNFDLKIGDSISKESKTRIFKVYRKNPLGKYQFYKKYTVE